MEIVVAKSSFVVGSRYRSDSVAAVLFGLSEFLLVNTLKKVYLKVRSTCFIEFLDSRFAPIMDD